MAAIILETQQIFTPKALKHTLTSFCWILVNLMRYS